MNHTNRSDLSELDLLAGSAGHRDGAFHQGLLLANAWLLFLVFPTLTVLAGDLHTSRKTIALALVAIFAVTHMVAYRHVIRRELGPATDRGPDRRRWWFVALVAITGAAFAVGSWPMLAVLPFIVAFAMFNFSWRAAGLVGGLSLTAVLVLPWVGGVLGDIWFFSILVLSVGAAAAMVRLNEEAHTERGLLLRQLAVSQERDRVARDVHDVLGHSLTVIVLKTQVCDRLLGSLRGDNTQRPNSPEADAVVDQARAHLAEVESVGRNALTEIRATVGGLRSADLADELAAARVVLADAGVELIVNGEGHELATDERSLLGWVVREAVTNVIRHAQATRCQIHLSPGGNVPGERLLLRICDDGVGLGKNRPGNGLAGLQERVGASGATLSITSVNGTTIEIIAPRHEIGG